MVILGAEVGFESGLSASSESALGVAWPGKRCRATGLRGCRIYGQRIAIQGCHVRYLAESDDWAWPGLEPTAALRWRGVGPRDPSERLMPAISSSRGARIDAGGSGFESSSSHPESLLATLLQI
jgi:hypothetical protein